MATLAISVCTVLLGIFAHVSSIRYLPAHLKIVSVPFFLIGSMILVIFTALIFEFYIEKHEIFVALILVLSLGFGYALTLVGVIHDSPTLSIINEIERYGSAGMPVANFGAFIDAHPFFESRLSALIAAHELELEEDKLVISGWAPYLLRAGDLYRQARGDDASRSG